MGSLVMMTNSSLAFSHTRHNLHSWKGVTSPWKAAASLPATWGLAHALQPPHNKHRLCKLWTPHVLHLKCCLSLHLKTQLSPVRRRPPGAAGQGLGSQEQGGQAGPWGAGSSPAVALPGLGLMWGAGGRPDRDCKSCWCPESLTLIYRQGTPLTLNLPHCCFAKQMKLLPPKPTNSVRQEVFLPMQPKAQQICRCCI